MLCVSNIAIFLTVTPNNYNNSIIIIIIIDSIYYNQVPANNCLLVFHFRWIWQKVMTFKLLILIALVITLFMSHYFWGGLNAEERQLFGKIIFNDTRKVDLLLNSEKRNLKVLSFNLRCNFLQPFDLMTVQERIGSLAEGIKEVDIALIQEAYILNTGITIISKCARHLVAEMEKHGLAYRTALKDLIAPNFGNSAGVIICSRIPLLNASSSQFHHFSVYQLADNRGFVIGKYTFNSKQLVVVNTHLDPHQVKSRVSQAKELATAVAHIMTPDVHIIVGGDFNADNHYPTTSNTSEEYLQLLATMAEVGLESIFPSRMETNTDGGHYDVIFASANIAVVKKEIIKLYTTKGELVSDHFGLAVELSF